jgi:anti-sigma factor RsiW
MNKPPSWTSREESLLLLNAYLDNELDAASVLDTERSLATDPALRAEHDRLAQLRSVLASHLTTQHASDDFRRHIAAIAEPPRGVVVPLPSRPSRRSYDWRQMAASAAIAAVVTAGGMYGALRSNLLPTKSPPFCRPPARAPRLVTLRQIGRAHV